MIESENEQLLRRIDAAENNLRNLRELVGPLVRRSWRAKFQPKLWQFVQYEPREVKEVSAAFVESPLPLHAPRIGIVTPSCDYAAFLGDSIMSVVNNPIRTSPMWCRTTTQSMTPPNSSRTSGIGHRS